jgi:5-methylcytosine-specific restriction enzyme subunit McrC
MPRAVVEALLVRPDLDGGVRTALRGMLTDLAGIQSVPLSTELRTAADAGPRVEGYRPLLDLCRLLADGLALGEHGGPIAGPTFLIDLERAFERHVTAAIEAAFVGRSRYRVAVQPYRLACPPMADQPDLHLRPDVLLERDGRPQLVLDVKWKRFSHSALPTDDVYQVLAYAVALGVPRAVLVFPGRRDRRWAYPIAAPGPGLEVWTLRITGSRVACERSRGRLGRDLRRRAR